MKQVNLTEEEINYLYKKTIEKPNNNHNLISTELVKKVNNKIMKDKRLKKLRKNLEKTK